MNIPDDILKKKHGMTKTPLYNKWVNMKQRCYNPNNSDYHNYGGRGIGVCKGWKDDFLSFAVWAFSSGYLDGLLLDRIDSNGNYEPRNCRWTDDEQQANNKRNVQLYLYKGTYMSLAQICRLEQLDKRTIWHRVVKQGMKIEDAISLGDNHKEGYEFKNSLKKRCLELGINYNAVKLRKSRHKMSEDEAVEFYVSLKNKTIDAVE